MSNFVGRERERARLSARLQAAVDGAGSVVLVGGEPGVGKTRLADEVAVVARGLGMVVASGRATDDEGSPPYRPISQVLSALGVPDLLVADAGSDGRVDVAAGERFRRYEAVVDALRVTAEKSGLFVLLDDVQWADAGTLRLLVHIARGFVRASDDGGARVVVVATYRTTETAGGSWLGEALSTLATEPVVERISLSGLTEQEVGVHLDAVSGFAVPTAVAHAVYQRTQGNPFFVGELGRLLIDSSTSDEQRLPDRIRDAVRVRLVRLSHECRRVVCAAAVLGSAPDAVALAGITGLDLNGVFTALDEASAAGMLHGTAGFTHDLIREAAALEVPTAERMVLHARMAGHLRARPDAGGRVAEVAHHLMESLPMGDAADAVVWSRRAGDHAAGLLAWEEAAAWYGRALEAAREVALPAAERSALFIVLAKAQVRGYDMDGARQSLIAAADIAREAGDAEALARAALVTEGVSDFVWDRVGRALATEAVAALPDTDSGLRARLLAQTVVMDAWQEAGDPGPRSLAAMEMAERVGDRRALVEALRARQFVHSGPDGAEERLELGARLLAIGQDGDDDALLWGRLWRFDAYAQLGELVSAAAETDAVAMLAERTRSTLVQWHAIRAKAALAGAYGHFDEALSLGERSVVLARRSGSEGSFLPSVGFLLGICAVTGDVADAPDQLALRHLDASGTGVLRGALARWRLAAGDRGAAERLYRGLPPIERVPRFVRLPAASGMIELAAEFGDLGAVARLYEVLLPHAHRFVCGGAGVIAIEGSAHMSLGIGASALGHHDEAVTYLRAAIDANQKAEMPPAVATARYRLAQALLRRGATGDREDAAVHVTAAAAAAERLGMRPLAERVAALPTAVAPADPLTPREREIGGYVGRGMTNKAIAAELFLSERTVETHVQRILTKLGLANRTQIANWIGGHR